MVRTLFCLALLAVVTKLLGGMFVEADQLVFKYWELSGRRGQHGSLICGFWHPRRSTLGMFCKGEAHNCISCGKLHGKLGFFFPPANLVFRGKLLFTLDFKGGFKGFCAPSSICLPPFSPSPLTLIQWR